MPIDFIICITSDSEFNILHIVFISSNIYINDTKTNPIWTQYKLAPNVSAQ